MASHARILAATEDCVRVRRADDSGPSVIAELFDSDGRSVLKLTDPTLEELAGELERAVDRPAYLDYLFSYRPVTEEDRRVVAALVADFESDDFETRDRASHALEKMGRPAWDLLRAWPRDGAEPESSARIEDVRAGLDRWNRRIEAGGLDHDVAYLAGIDDPRSHERLKRILAGVRPFSTDGFPDSKPGLAEYLRGWWAYSKDRVAWNPASDRFERGRP